MSYNYFFAVNKVVASELRGKGKEDLVKQLDELKKELFQLRVSKVTGGSNTQLLNIGKVRKGISRVLSVISQTEKSELRKYYADKQYTPKNLRQKHSRAFRRQLSKEEKTIKSRRTARKNSAFPQRKFALLA